MDLNQISVFDPVLYSDRPENEEMRARYQECFAPQLHNRISFNLDGSQIGNQEHYGTGLQFVKVLEKAPNKIFF